MASLALPPPAPTADRRLAGIAATILVHAALVLCWQMARTLPAPAQVEGPAMQWLRLPPLVPDMQPAPAEAARPPVRSLPAPSPGRSPARPAPAAAAEAPTPAPISQQAAPEPAPAAQTPPPSAATILENARRSVGSIDRALRKESKPLIVAPPDSPQLRMRQGMEEAHALAPPRLWEAPKVEELVNNTGDGARRTRVITGRRTYCITERSPATNITTIEMHGKIMLTNCPSDETPAKRQEWRTARD